MNGIVFRTGKLDDLKIIEMVDAFAERFGNGGGSIHILTSALSYPLSPENRHLFSKGAQNISQVNFTSAGNKFYLRFRRGRGNNLTNIDAGGREPSPYVDEIGLEAGNMPNGGQYNSPEDFVAAQNLLQSFLTTFIPDPMDKDVRGASEFLQAQIDGLAKLHKKMLVDVSEQKKTLEAEYSRLRQHLTEDFRQQQVDFEDVKKNELSKLDIEKQALADREKELDNRDHMHARRRLRENITTDIKARLEKTIISNTANAFRLAVLVGIALAAVFLGGMAYKSLQEFVTIVHAASIISTQSGTGVYTSGTQYVQELSNTSPLQTWFLLIRGTLASLGTLGFVLYGLRWMRQLYYEDIRSRQDFEQYAYDINRASWIIETVMEMTSKQGGNVPSAWIEGVCRNLFQSGEKKKEDGATPAEALWTALNSSAKVKLGTNGVEFELNRKDAKKLAKAINATDDE